MIIAFIGGLGSGKTLSMVKYMADEKRKVYTNFKVNIPEVDVEYLDVKFFEHYAKSKFNVYKAIVAIDECHVYFDSRNTQKKSHKVFTRFITQSRKRKVDLIYTTQESDPKEFMVSGQVELRLRKLTDVLVMCQYIELSESSWCVNTWMDKQGKVMDKQIFRADDYYDMYDSDEIVDMEE